MRREFCWWLAASVALGTACVPLKRVPLLQTTVKLEAGRFVGPVEVKVPRHAEHGGHDFEVNVRVVAACDPQFTLAFPDGEQRALGVEDDRWQGLLRARAGVVAEAPLQAAQPPPPHAATPMTQTPMTQTPMTQTQTPTPTPTQQAPMTQTPTQQAPTQQTASSPDEWMAVPPSRPAPVPQPVVEAGAAVDAQVVVPSPTVGRWERTVTERWEGQVEFEAERQRRCGATRTFTAKYRNAFDDTNTVALWATVPQELTDAELTVEVIELVPPPPAPVVEAKVEARVAVTSPPKPRPPKPSPRSEHPRPAKDPGATWQPGRWMWSEGEGEWVWASGGWREPATKPAARLESPGAPPVAGCGWKSGFWFWIDIDGHWEWNPGHWTEPPPLVEDRGEAPDPTAPWLSGRWNSVHLPTSSPPGASNGTFRWEPGRWGRPKPRAETQPPKPRGDAEWIPGQWVFIAGKWTWSGGFWSGTERPPPPRAETPPPRPHPDAVWLAGFWRWSVTARTHVWIDGHWELPPGEGYVWVEEKLGPDLVVRGHWELRVRR